MTMTRKTTVRWLILLALAVAGAGAIAFLLAPRPLNVETGAVGRGPVAETVSDQGWARARQSYTVAAPATGRVERLPVEVGDKVVANRTVVARLTPASAAFLDPRARAQAEAAAAEARSALAAAEANRMRLDAEAVRARGEAERMAPLVPSGVSRQAYDNALAAQQAAAQAVAAADAEIRSRRASLRQAEAALMGPEAEGPGMIAVTSPASGVVTRLLQQSERPVAAGSPLVEVGETNGLEAQIEFLSQDAVKIRPGMKAEIYDWGGARPIPAEVRLVEPQGFTKVSALGVEEQRALVMLQFTGPPESWAGLAPGYRLWGRVFLRQTPSAVVAPLGALVRDQGGWAVFRLEQGKARLRPIQVGALTDTVAEVLTGLKPGDRLVVYPSDQVRDGVAVKSR
ncbi:MAG: efflux RND transporter periplasmic adaptor subunit [Caulobacteraceae bacterium]